MNRGGGEQGVWPDPPGSAVAPSMVSCTLSGPVHPFLHGAATVILADCQSGTCIHQGPARSRCPPLWVLTEGLMNRLIGVGMLREPIQESETSRDQQQQGAITPPPGMRSEGDGRSFWKLGRTMALGEGLRSRSCGC